uniref:Uncharacterized protein n=1 Tax=Cucumis melo TaxID=3656 RepID=A0A9I9EBD6_CUCME
MERDEMEEKVMRREILGLSVTIWSKRCNKGVLVELGSLFGMGKVKGTVVYAIVGVVLVRGVSEIIHKESEFHVFRFLILDSGCLTGQEEIDQIYTSEN